MEFMLTPFPLKHEEHSVRNCTMLVYMNSFWFWNFCYIKSIFKMFSCSAVVLENENSSIHIDAVIDPLSSSGQKLSSLLRLVSKSVRPSMRLVLNPMVS